MYKDFGIPAREGATNMRQIINQYVKVYAASHGEMIKDDFSLTFIAMHL